MAMVTLSLYYVQACWGDSHMCFSFEGCWFWWIEERAFGPRFVVWLLVSNLGFLC